MGWLVVNIGCIECGVSSNVVGCFATEEEAAAAAEKLDAVLGWREGGQNAFAVFKAPAVGDIEAEYLAALSSAPEGGS